MHTLPQRVADAHEHLHELQTDLAFGDPVSLRCDEAADAYSDAVADATAARFAKIQDLVEAMRLTAEDQTGLRDHARRYSNEITGAVPADTFALLADVIAAVVANRRQVADLGSDLVGVDGRAGVRLDRIEAALAAAGIAAKS